MRPSVYWIGMQALPSNLPGKSNYLGRLAIMARPRAGDWLVDEVADWKVEGIDTVVSLLERDEVEELGLREEAALCKREGINFLSFAIADRGVPTSAPAVIELVDELLKELRKGKSIAIHCRAGIGRSSLMAACVMVRGGISVSQAFDQIGTARGVQVPDTEGQRAWVEHFGAPP